MTDAYTIVRFYRDDRPTAVIKTGLSLDAAMTHCQRDDTHGVDWFDAFQREDARA